MNEGQIVSVVYTNHAGVTRRRWIVPLELWCGETRWHPLAQWLLKAVDVETGEEKDFAMSGFALWGVPGGEVEEARRPPAESLTAATDLLAAARRLVAAFDALRFTDVPDLIDGPLREALARLNGGGPLTTHQMLGALAVACVTLVCLAVGWPLAFDDDRADEGDGEEGVRND